MSAFTLLGSGGWIPTPRRETTCALLSLPQALFIFDAGTGLALLLEEKFRRELEPEREIHIFLSHYHLDHVAGLVYLPAMFKRRRVHLHPPAADITGLDPGATVAELVRKPFNPTSLEGMPVDVTVEPLGEGCHDITGTQVRVRKQIHADASAAWRVDDLIVFATDTAADLGTAVFAEDVRLLVHEAWIDGIEEEDPATEQIAREAYVAHTSARQAAGLAKDAHAGRLVLCHLSPVRSPEYHRQMLASARSIFPDTYIMEDGESLDL